MLGGSQGEAEKGLCDIGDANKGFEVFCARPTGVLQPDVGLLIRVAGKLLFSIGADQLAGALTKIFLEGYPERIIENEALLKM